MKPFGNLASIGRQLTREERIQVAWDNIPSLFGYSILKLDCDNRLISQYEYGKTSRFGWEIDHTIPIFLGGSDAPWNLRARHHLGKPSAGGMGGTRAKKLGFR